MHEPLFYYDVHTKHWLKDTYPAFYYHLSAFVSSLPEQWFFEECYNPDYDGTRFSIILRDSYQNHMSVSATKKGTTYEFTVINQ